MNDNDDEGFLETKESTMMLDKKNLLPHQSITSKSISIKPSHYSCSTRNPYDDGLSFFIFYSFVTQELLGENIWNSINVFRVKDYHDMTLTRTLDWIYL